MKLEKISMQKKKAKKIMMKILLSGMSAPIAKAKYFVKIVAII